MTTLPLGETTPFSDSPKEECGLMGVYAPGKDVAQMCLFGLLSLQHRGQEAAGISVSTGKQIDYEKGTGMISNVFANERLSNLKGINALGHTRYSTTGGTSTRNIQPYVIETAHGPLALAHNGNITNADKLRDELLAKGVGLTSFSDSEVLLMMIAGAKGNTWAERIKNTMPKWEGAFSLVFQSRTGLYAVRDPWGFRPLSIGYFPDWGYAVASETCALNTLGCIKIREVLPGEIVVMNYEGVNKAPGMKAKKKTAFCTFEHVYFSRADSEWDGQSINSVRERMGAELAREAPVEADLVIAVPSSAIPAAIGYAKESRIVYSSGLTKNNYVGRTFIQPTDELRQLGIRLKFNALPYNLEGERVILVDDSIVRGNTSKALVKLIRDSGAKEVHVRVSSPPIISPCFMGVDMGTYDELIAHRLEVDEIRQYIGADSLHYITLDGMMKAINSKTTYCNACFTRDYPIDVQAFSSSKFKSQS